MRGFLHTLTLIQLEALNVLLPFTFQILYATDEEQLAAAVKDLHNLPHQQYIDRVEKLLRCQKEWVLMYRAGLMTCGHNTKNYSEASMRILKDILLCRTKA